MRWTPSALMTGMQSLLGSFAHGTGARSIQALDDIRHAMLDGLTRPDIQTPSKLELRVTYAHDLHDLWYLRGDLMAAIAALHGESAARQKLTEISNMFKGLLPKSLTSRPSPLGG